MTEEKRQCQNCKRAFTIEPDDFTFYEKIQVSPPRLCHQCRRQRRLAWRNDLAFYNRACNRCGRRIISLYSPDKKLTVYCNRCWWKDDWDARDYGRDIDFSRPFFEQFRELLDAVPLMALVNDDGVGSVNCEYTHNVSFAKNCYMGSMSWKNEDCMYFLHVAGPNLRYVVDANDVFYNSELIYDSIFLEHCSRCRECYYSTSLLDCAFCYDCQGCTSCFMCYGLRNKKYCFKNEQYSKEEYEKILKEYQLDTWSGLQRAKEEFFPFIDKFPRRFAIIRNCVDSTGDAIFNCKNTKHSFSARACEDVKYFESGNEVKDSYDLCTGGESLQCYEGLTADMEYRGLFTIFSWKSREVTYCQDCHSCEYLFGCASLKNHARYCILNKQYSEEEYKKLREKLMKHMRETGEWGEFFPIHLSHFGYNETMANLYFPFKKEEALQRGYKWQDALQFTTGKETMKPEELPDNIKDVSDLITEEILTCVTCGRNYRIVPQELQFYRRVGIPLPRECFYCRNAERLRIRHPYNLWNRMCMCDYKIYKNSIAHPHHPEGKCPNEFETPYAPERHEIVYCEQCYNAEVV